MSVLPLKADIRQCKWHVRYGNRSARSFIELILSEQIRLRCHFRTVLSFPKKMYESGLICLTDVILKAHAEASPERDYNGHRWLRA
jgi:hypothetical protein